MRVFLDFEASSLGKRGYPVEVAWVFEDERSESHLIRPAPDWNDWDEEAEAIHGISRAKLERDGEPVEEVGRRMVDVLTGHDLLASAPSWDGKWLSVLLRAAGLPRHALRLRDTEEAQREAVEEALEGIADGAVRRRFAAELLRESEERHQAEKPRHRALADAEAELRRWRLIGDAARARAADVS